MFMAGLLRLYQLEVLTGVCGPKYTTYLRMPYVLKHVLKIHLWPEPDLGNSSRQKYMAAVPRGISETSGKIFYFCNLFSIKVQLYLWIYLLLNFSIYLLVILLFFSAEHFLNFFSFNFIRQSNGESLRRTVDKLLNGLRVNLHGHFIFAKQSLSLFRGSMDFQGNSRCSNLSQSLDMVKTHLGHCHAIWQRYKKLKGVFASIVFQS